MSGFGFNSGSVLSVEDYGSGFELEGLGAWNQGFEWRAWGLGNKVQGLGTGLRV